MLKNKKLWLNLAAILVFTIPSLSAFAGAPGVNPRGAAVSVSALGDLLYGSTAGSLAVLPSIAEAGTPALPAEVPGTEVRASAPAPGTDLTPKIEDPVRVKAILKLVSDIYNGVHLPYSQDGSVFKNKEGRLPRQPNGFYRVYFLLTGKAPHVVVIGGTTYQVAPDLSARGSERVIIGGGEKVYYTPDHYANFILLTVVR